MAASLVPKCNLLFHNILRSFCTVSHMHGRQKCNSLLVGRYSHRYFSSRTIPLLQLPPQHSASYTETKETSHKTTDDSPSSHLEDPYAEEVEPCLLCKTNIPVSYKNPKLLSQFVSPNTGRIYSRQITRLCQMQQDRITKAITLSRVHGFMPVMYRETYFLKDPNLFDVKYTGSADIGEHIKFPGPNSSGESPITMVNKKTFADKTKARKREKPKLTKTEKRKNKAR